MSALIMHLTLTADGYNIAYAIWVHMLTTVWVKRVDSGFIGMNVQ